MERQPDIPSPEEQAEKARSRTLSDAKLIKDGANYVPPKEGESRPRLEVTEDQHRIGLVEMDEDLEKRRKEVIEENKEINLRAFLESIPGLKEKIDCIELEGIGDRYILRLKTVPDVGILVAKVSGGGDKTRLHLNYVDGRYPHGTVYKEVESPVPSWLIRTGKDGSRIEGLSDIGAAARAKEVAGIIEKACKDSSLASLAVRGGEEYWDEAGLPRPEGVTLLDARYPEVFTGMMGMPDYGLPGDSYSVGIRTSDFGGYDPTKPYPTFDWHREF